MTARDIEATYKVKEDDANPATGEEMSGTISYDFGDNLEESVALFGAELVHNKFLAAVIVDLQARMRGEMRKEGYTQAALVAALAEWKPTLRAPAKPKAERVRELYATLSDEEKKQLLKQMREDARA